MPTDWPQKLKDTFQPHVTEPILAVGLLQPAGTWGAFGVMKLSPLAGMFKAKSASDKAGGLAKTSVFANTKLCGLVLTADKAYAFRAKQKGMNWKVEEQLGAWDRKDATFTITDKTITKHIAIDIKSTGDHFELEATTVGTKGFHDPFFAELDRS